MFDVKAAFATITERDYSGTATWNPHGIRPAVRCALHLPGYPLTPACRVLGFRSHEGEGIHWPVKVGDVVLVMFLGGEAPQVLPETWADGVNPPDGANENNAIFKLHGHKIMFEETGLSIATSDGKAIILKDDYISIAHPKGQTVVMDADGNVKITVPKNYEATVAGDLKETVTGSVDITAQGTVTIGGKLGVELNTENKISLKTLKAIAGIINRLTHPKCYITGADIGASESVEAGS